MLARLEQALVLGWLLAGAGWLAWTVPQSQWLAAIGGLALLLVAHALWLALTFSLMRWQNRSDPVPLASWRQCIRAWWDEVRAAPRVFGWQQPFRSQAEPDYLPAPGSRGRVGVVLVHGFVCNRGLWTRWMRALRERGIPCVAVNLEPVFGSIDDYAQAIDAAVRRVELASGLPPLLVGHSMGGLAIRAWLQACQADHRVHGVITLGTPHRGTWLARLALALNGRQMAPGSDWLQGLARDEPASRRQLFVCGFSDCDNIVFPASHGVLPGSRAWRVKGSAHVAMLDRPEVLDVVLAALHQWSFRPPPDPG